MPAEALSGLALSQAINSCKSFAVRSFLATIINGSLASCATGCKSASRSNCSAYSAPISTSTTHVLIGALYALQFDLLTDLQPVAERGSEPLMIVARKQRPADHLRRLEKRT